MLPRFAVSPAERVVPEFNRIGDSLQLSRLRLARIIDGGVRQDAMRRNDRRVVALDDARRSPIRVFASA
jgi:hypothetical protein